MQLVYYPDPILNKTSKPVTHVDEEVRRRVTEMFAIMYAEGGVGLAAPQVGWSVRLFITNVYGESKPEFERVYINPELVTDRDVTEVRDEEGCLSIPGARGKVLRYEHMTVRALDLQAREFEEEVSDLQARVVQHENDHLDGILFVTRLSITDRLQVGKTLKKLAKEYRENQRGAATRP